MAGVATAAVRNQRLAPGLAVRSLVHIHGDLGVRVQPPASTGRENAVQEFGEDPAVVELRVRQCKLNAVEMEGIVLNKM